jgi:Na+-driven multidrug efflux pump
MASLFSPVIWVRSFVLANGMKGAGDVKFTTTIALTSMFVFRVMFAYILGVTMHLGTLGIWCGMMIDWTFRSIVFSIRYYSGRWLTKGVL